MHYLEQIKTVHDIGPDPFLDLSELYRNDDQEALRAGRKFIAALYDPKQKAGRYHGSLNDFRFRLATIKETSLAKLPPSEASFKQHLCRASWQAKMWTNAHHAVPNVPSPVGHGWKQQDETIVPTFFDGPVSAQVLRGLVCSCRNICSGKCECELNKLPCTEICPCQGDDKCKNELTQNLEDIVESEEDIEEVSSRKLFQGVTCECSGENVWNNMYVPVKWAYLHSCMPLRRQGRLP